MGKCQLNINSSYPQVQNCICLQQILRQVLQTSSNPVCIMLKYDQVDYSVK